MRTRLWIAAIVALAAATWWHLARRAPAPAVTPGTTTEAVAVAPPASRGRIAGPPSARFLTAARHTMGEAARRESCGPYDLLTDAGPSWPAALCASIAVGLDPLYREIFGVEPAGPPRGAVLIFQNTAELRRFAREVTSIRSGYAGFSDAARGIVAVHLQEQSPEQIAATLAHELTHLVHRRAFGPGLPPWLSEGLADAIGDPARPQGLREPRGIEGSEVAAGRLAGALDTERARPVAELLALGRAEFDRGVVSFDYEQSALLVRFLLADRELAPRFRQFLDDLTRRSYSPPALLESLGLDAETLDGRFREWFLAQTEAAGLSARS